jgi:hypothetical protein
MSCLKVFVGSSDLSIGILKRRTYIKEEATFCSFLKLPNPSLKVII